MQKQIKDISQTHQNIFNNSSQPTLHEDHHNLNKKQNKPDYQLFLKWFQNNGGLYNSQQIQFPTFFQPTKYLGISALQDIKPNKVIAAIPYKLIIGVSTVRKNQHLSKIIKQHHILNNTQNQESEFNILTLFLIYQKMKGQKSFYYPYLQTVTNVQTMIDWTNQQIRSLKDPFITIPYVEEIRQQFIPVFSVFSHIVKENHQLFAEEFNMQIFLECSQFVMTRCFGWGLPQTMLVPFADFFNHNSYGVNHYMFSRYYQQSYKSQKYQNLQEQFKEDQILKNKIEKIQKQHEYQHVHVYEHGYYIKKNKELNLTLLQINNQNYIQKAYQPHQRQFFIIQNIKNFQKYKEYNTLLRFRPKITNRVFLDMQKQLLKNSCEVDLLLSTDSQDNDTESQIQSQSSDDEDSLKQKAKKQQQNKSSSSESSSSSDEIQQGFIKNKKYQKQIKKQLQRQKQSIPTKNKKINLQKILKKSKQPFQKHYFNQPKLNSNRQFQDGINFQWWKQKTQNNYFIVSTANYVQKGDQIYNSYGQRNNKFLLPWYGFCIQKNKYDSVAFRLWNDRVKRQTGQYLYCTFITEKQVHKGIFLNLLQPYQNRAKKTITQRKYTINDLTKQFRLKLSGISLQLIVFLRFQIMRKSQIYSELYKNRKIFIQKPANFILQLEILDKYGEILGHLEKIYKIHQDRSIPSMKNIDLNQEKIDSSQKCKKQARIYFRNLLVKSNKDIILSQINCIRILKQFVLEIIKIKQQEQQIKQKQTQKKIQKFDEIYRKISFTKGICNQLLQSSTEQQRKQLLDKIQFKYRKMVVPYIRLLKNSCFQYKII